MLPKVLVFASGTKDGGGSGFQNLVEWSRQNPGTYDVVGVVSNHESGGVAKRATDLKIPFIYFPGPYEASEYQKIAQQSGAEWFALSGWLKMVKGLDPKRTFNIHPALLSELNGKFGGEGMWGGKVLDAVYDALQKGETHDFGVSMHFVTDEFDRGPIVFEDRIPFKNDLSKEQVSEITHEAEHEFQPKVTCLVVNGHISWDGKNVQSVKVPAGYTFLPT